MDGMATPENKDLKCGAQNGGSNDGTNKANEAQNGDTNDGTSTRSEAQNGGMDHGTSAAHNEESSTICIAQSESKTQNGGRDASYRIKVVSSLMEHDSSSISNISSIEKTIKSVNSLFLTESAQTETIKTIGSNSTKISLSSQEGNASISHDSFSESIERHPTHQGLLAAQSECLPETHMIPDIAENLVGTDKHGENVSLNCDGDHNYVKPTDTSLAIPLPGTIPESTGDITTAGGSGGADIETGGLDAVKLNASVGCEKLCTQDTEQCGNLKESDCAEIHSHRHLTMADSKDGLTESESAKINASLGCGQCTQDSVRCVDLEESHCAEIHSRRHLPMADAKDDLTESESAKINASLGCGQCTQDSVCCVDLKESDCTESHSHGHSTKDDLTESESAKINASLGCGQCTQDSVCCVDLEESHCAEIPSRGCSTMADAKDVLTESESGKINASVCCEQSGVQDSEQCGDLKDSDCAESHYRRHSTTADAKDVLSEAGKLNASVGCVQSYAQDSELCCDLKGSDCAEIPSCGCSTTADAKDVLSEAGKLNASAVCEKSCETNFEHSLPPKAQNTSEDTRQLSDTLAQDDKHLQQTNVVDNLTPEQGTDILTKNPNSLEGREEKTDDTNVKSIKSSDFSTQATGALREDCGPVHQEKADKIDEKNSQKTQKPRQLPDTLMENLVSSQPAILEGIDSEIMSDIVNSTPQSCIENRCSARASTSDNVGTNTTHSEGGVEKPWNIQDSQSRRSGHETAVNTSASNQTKHSQSSPVSAVETDNLNIRCAAATLACPTMHQSTELRNQWSPVSAVETDKTYITCTAPTLACPTTHQSTELRNENATLKQNQPKVVTINATDTNSSLLATVEMASANVGRIAASASDPPTSQSAELWGDIELIGADTLDEQSDDPMTPPVTTGGSKVDTDDPRLLLRDQIAESMTEVVEYAYERPFGANGKNISQQSDDPMTPPVTTGGTKVDMDECTPRLPLRDQIAESITEEVEYADGRLSSGASEKASFSDSVSVTPLNTGNLLVTKGGCAEDLGTDHSQNGSISLSPSVCDGQHSTDTSEITSFSRSISVSPTTAHEMLATEACVTDHSTDQGVCSDSVSLSPSISATTSKDVTTRGSCAKNITCEDAGFSNQKDKPDTAEHSNSSTSMGMKKMSDLIFPAKGLLENIIRTVLGVPSQPKEATDQKRAEKKGCHTQNATPTKDIKDTSNTVDENLPQDDTPTATPPTTEANDQREAGTENHTQNATPKAKDGANGRYEIVPQDDTPTAPPTPIEETEPREAGTENPARNATPTKIQISPVPNRSPGMIRVTIPVSQGKCTISPRDKFPWRKMLSAEKRRETLSVGCASDLKDGVCRKLELGGGGRVLRSRALSPSICADQAKVPVSKSCPSSPIIYTDRDTSWRSTERPVDRQSSNLGSHMKRFSMKRTVSKLMAKNNGLKPPPLRPIDKSRLKTIRFPQNVRIVATRPDGTIVKLPPSFDSSTPRIRDTKSKNTKVLQRVDDDNAAKIAESILRNQRILTHTATTIVKASKISLKQNTAPRSDDTSLKGVSSKRVILRTILPKSTSSVETKVHVPSQSAEDTDHGKVVKTSSGLSNHSENVDEKPASKTSSRVKDLIRDSKVAKIAEKTTFKTMDLVEVQENPAPCSKHAAEMKEMTSKMCGTQNNVSSVKTTKKTSQDTPIQYKNHEKADEPADNNGSTAEIEETSKRYELQNTKVKDASTGSRAMKTTRRMTPEAPTQSKDTKHPEESPDNKTAAETDEKAPEMRDEKNVRRSKRKSKPVRHDLYAKSPRMFLTQKQLRKFPAAVVKAACSDLERNRVDVASSETETTEAETESEPPTTVKDDNSNEEVDKYETTDTENSPGPSRNTNAKRSGRRRPRPSSSPAEQSEDGASAPSGVIAETATASVLQDCSVQLGPVETLPSKRSNLSNELRLSASPKMRRTVKSPDNKKWVISTRGQQRARSRRDTSSSQDENATSDRKPQRDVGFRHLPKLSNILATFEPGVTTCCFCRLPANHILGIGDLFGPYRPLAEEVMARHDSVNERLKMSPNRRTSDPAHAADGSPQVTIDRDESTSFITARVEPDATIVEGSSVGDVASAVSRSSHRLRTLQAVDHLLQDSTNRSWQNKQKLVNPHSRSPTLRIPGPKDECKLLPSVKYRLPKLLDPKIGVRKPQNEGVLPDINSIVFMEPKISVPHVTPPVPDPLEGAGGSSRTHRPFSPDPCQTKRKRRSRDPTPTCGSPLFESGNFNNMGPGGKDNDSTIMEVSHRFSTPPIWTHGNCAVWADGVYAIRGQLYGLWDATRSASLVVCRYCGRTGATICCDSDKHQREQNGVRAYHYPCALSLGLDLDWSTLRARKRSSV